MLRWYYKELDSRGPVLQHYNPNTGEWQDIPIVVEIPEPPKEALGIWEIS